MDRTNESFRRKVGQRAASIVRLENTQELDLLLKLPTETSY